MHARDPHPMMAALAIKYKSFRCLFISRTTDYTPSKLWAGGRGGGRINLSIPTFHTICYPHGDGAGGLQTKTKRTGKYNLIRTVVSHPNDLAVQKSPCSSKALGLGLRVQASL